MFSPPLRPHSTLRFPFLKGNSFLTDSTPTSDSFLRLCLSLYSYIDENFSIQFISTTSVARPEYPRVPFCPFFFCSCSLSLVLPSSDFPASVVSCLLCKGPDPLAARSHVFYECRRVELMPDAWKASSAPNPCSRMPVGSRDEVIVVDSSR